VEIALRGGDTIFSVELMIPCPFTSVPFVLYQHVRRERYEKDQGGLEGKVYRGV
jgi:hypothetical protein